MKFTKLSKERDEGMVLLKKINTASVKRIEERKNGWM